MPELQLSVVIITLNEEQNLERCLRSLPNGAELFVVDSGSNDRTSEIADEFAAHFCHRPFDNYSNQKNYALSLAKRAWILSIDADEQLSPELRDSILKIVSNERVDPNAVAAYRLPRRLHFMGRLLRFGKTSDAPIRLFRSDSGKFMGAIHESFVPLSGKTELIRSGCIVHYSYKNLTDYFDRFNRYTSMIADDHYRAGQRTGFVVPALRFWWELLSRLIFRLGILDGKAGYTFALLSAFYAQTKYLKLYERCR